MLIEKKAWLEIKKRQLELGINNEQMSIILGLSSKRSFTDMLFNIKRGKGYISEEKVFILETILKVKIKKFTQN